MKITPFWVLILVLTVMRSRFEKLVIMKDLLPSSNGRRIAALGGVFVGQYVTAEGFMGCGDKTDFVFSSVRFLSEHNFMGLKFPIVGFASYFLFL